VRREFANHSAVEGGSEERAMGPDTVQTIQRVLFVDDEPAILRALARLLRPLRHEFESEFVASGAEALARLEQAPFDVVVSDIRMPVMDGTALLTEVQRAHPRVLRIVLSGHADTDAALRALPVAHQFLAKPCDAATLRHVIARAMVLRGLLADRQLQAVVGGMREIPARPRSYGELSRLLGEQSTSAREIALLVSHDVALSASLLKIVNSAFVGAKRRVTSIEAAVSHLGTSMLRAAVFATAATTSLGPRAQRYGYPLELNEAHALLCAELASQLFHEKHAREDAFAAGLLHNVGELLLLADGSPNNLSALAHAQQHAMALHDAERELDVASHAHVGAYLLGVWGLPYSIVEAVAYHHAPPPRAAHAELNIVDAVYVSVLIADHFLMHSADGLERAAAHLSQCGAAERLAELTNTAETWLQLQATAQQASRLEL
jgi:HD-like signal output (HDOD) protein/ActR/RegA family two-component response regulator